VDSAPRRALFQFAVPGGALWLAAVLLAYFAPVRSLAPAFLDAFSWLIFAAGALLAWRFRSSRVLFTLLALWLADRALVTWAAHPATGATARAALDLVALLLPVNLVFFCLLGEVGFSLESLGYGSGILLLQTVGVTVLCRPENAGIARWLERGVMGGDLLSWSRLPQAALLLFAAGFAVFATRAVTRRKPVESAFFWSLAAAFLALQWGTGRAARIQFAAAGVILVVALIENSYRLAYQDELTGLPARRALNEALLAVGGRFAVAMVDVDHFKLFNDRFGHDAGDQVLRLVAARLADVEGGGEAFRYGGEEFAILFAEASAEETLPHLEELRQSLEATRFVVRGPDRSQRRRPERRYTPPGRRPVGETRAVARVTISLGVAEVSERNPTPELVVHAADQALYRAKEAGRNRIEVAGRRTLATAIGG
jgi:diguanylate cyclase (GGDEF)-like protein